MCKIGDSLPTVYLGEGECEGEGELIRRLGNCKTGFSPPVILYY